MATKRYRATVGLSYPTSSDVVRRILRGEERPGDRDANREVAAGDVVDDIPSASLPWLLESGAVEETTDPLSVRVVAEPEPVAAPEPEPAAKEAE